MKKILLKWILLFLTCAVMLMIFSFSSQNAESSDRTSGVLVNSIIPYFCPHFDGMDPGEQKTVYDSISFVIRKLAHFSEFALLGFLIRLTLEAWFGNGKRSFSLVSLGCGALYACTDELHQLLVEARSGQMMDVLIDTLGVGTGIVFAWTLLMLYRRSHVD